MSGTDGSGCPITAAHGPTIERYDAAIDSLLAFSDDVSDLWDAAVADEPDFAMGQIGRSYLRCISSEGPDAADARAILEDLGDGQGLHDREQRHLAAAHAYAAGDLRGASEILALLSADYPRDLLGLAVGHQLDFFRGDSTLLRDRIARATYAWDDADPRCGFVLGMLSFGLEECGLYPQAETAALDALDRNPRDVWALHGVVHTYEMQGRVEDGLREMEKRRPDWGTGNVFVVHNSWHETLFFLERGDVERVLEIYDASIRHPGSENVALEMLDASALLWRLHLDGVETAGRWSALADAWAQQDSVPWYSFNDMHAVMAFVGAERLRDARAVVDRLAAYAATPSPEISNVAMTADVGLPVCAAILAFGEARYDEVVALLHPIRTIVHRFGGSHAQRDAVARTLLEAAVRGGEVGLARALVSERLTLRPSSRYAQVQLARLEASGSPS